MRDHFDQIPGAVKATLDIVSITTLLGSLAAMLPAVASIFTIIWTGLRIYESPTVQSWITNRKEKS